LFSRGHRGWPAESAGQDSRIENLEEQMNYQEIIKELDFLARGGRTNSTDKAVREAIEIIKAQASASGQPEDRKKEG